MSSTIVSTCSGGNLNAIAQRGARDTIPSVACWSNRSTFTTTPSVSYGSAWRGSRQRSVNAMTASMSSPDARFGLTGNPSAANRSSAADWAVTARSSAMSWYSQADRRRLAVTAGSCWRRDPAPLLRGLAYRARPASSRSALIRANSALGMNTSPRASRVAGSGSRFGITSIVRRLALTSSPVVPSPRVAPWANRPRS